MLNQLSGELKPERGQIFLKGMDITRASPHRRAQLGLGRSFQVSSLLEEFTVRENLALAKQAHVGR